MCTVLPLMLYGTVSEGHGSLAIYWTRQGLRGERDYFAPNEPTRVIPVPGLGTLIVKVPATSVAASP